MAVFQPVGCFHMDLHIPGPDSITNTDPGVEEIRPGICIMLPGPDYPDGFASGCGEINIV